MGYQYTPYEFAEKIDSEGGIFHALDYGLRATDLADPASPLGVLWTRLEAEYEKLKPLIGELDAVLDKIENEDGNQ